MWEGGQREAGGAINSLGVVKPLEMLRDVVLLLWNGATVFLGGVNKTESKGDEGVRSITATALKEGRGLDWMSIYRSHRKVVLLDSV